MSFACCGASWKMAVVNPWLAIDTLAEMVDEGEIDMTKESAEQKFLKASIKGVIKTMSAIDQPPEVLGKLIGGALVGTFLGVFLSYGLVGPFANKVGAVIEEDHHFYLLIREVMVANLHGHPPNVCVEVGRQNTPHGKRPSFNDLDEALRAGRTEATV